MREESLDDAGILLSSSLWVDICEDADAGDEPAETVMFTLGEAASGRKSCRIFWLRLYAKEFQAEANERSVLVHDAGGDIDVNEHSSDSGTD